MIYDIKQFLKNFFKSRLFILTFVIILLFTIVLGRVFSLQIVNGEAYQKNFTLKIENKLSIDASRGNIYDCNGQLLAYNKLAYSVIISDTGSYVNNSSKNEELNAELAEIINVILGNKEEIYNDFSIVLNEDNEYEFNVTGSGLERFLADVFGKSSYADLEYNTKLNFNESTATADEVMSYLMSDQNECFDVSSEYDKVTAYNIVVIRYAIKSTRFRKYETTTIAKDVSDKTVAYMNEHSDTLTGVSIKEDTIRKYKDSEYFASIIGYTGKISTDEYNELHEKDKSYTPNDIVGKSGLEDYYEEYLRGKNGEQRIYVNNVGKVTEVLSEENPVAGNNLYLTIDADLQKATYKLLEQEIAGIVYTNIKKGQIPINDVYFALINNSIVDLTHFSSKNASSTEKTVLKSFKTSQKSTLKSVKNKLKHSNTTVNNMSDSVCDYFTYIMSMLKENNVLLTKKIDTTDSTYKKWQNGNMSPKEYLNYCIEKQWIDITKLDVDQKYADSSEMYDAFCDYVIKNLKDDPEFSKIIYKYMVKSGKVTGKQLCLMLFDQGVLDYDDATVNKLKNGTTSPYAFLLKKINNIEITPAQLALDPCTGSCIITDIKTGKLKALVSYPGYDNNKLANGVDVNYYNKIRTDKAKPLWNYATQEQTAPGSTFKMVSSTAGMAEGVISTSSSIKCTGIYKDISNQPKCWIYPHGTHGSINVSQALRDSCNVFYYTVGNRLAQKKTGKYDEQSGLKYLNKYASTYGLDQPSGLEIVENTSQLADEFPVMAAIGQSNNNITTVALSRYVTAVVSGKLYDYSLMSKIVDTDGNVIKKYKSKSDTITSMLSNDQWNAIHRGMRMVCENLDSFDGFDIPVAGKTGTAQQNKRPNHALFVGYAPYDNPEISIATRISNGYSSHNAASASRNIFSYYFGEQKLDEILSAKASGVNTASSNSVGD